MSGSIGELLAGVCQRYAGRPPGATGYDELVTNARSALLTDGPARAESYYN